MATLEKKFKLALNSVTDKNLDEVCRKIKALGSECVDLMTERGENVVDLLVGNAIMQPIYAGIYVQIVLFMIDNKLCQQDVVLPIVLARCDKQTAAIAEGKLSKLVCRGVGWFHAHLFVMQLNDFQTLCDTMLKLCDILETSEAADVQEQACEVLTCIILKVGEHYGASCEKQREQWEGPVLERIVAMWDDKRLNMRVRVRMFDIKDSLGFS